MELRCYDKPGRNKLAVFERIIRRRFSGNSVAFCGPLSQVNQLAALTAKGPERAGFLVPQDFFAALRAGNNCWFLRMHD